MTATDPLAPIRARAEGLTDLCPEHLGESIRHIRRNCEIDCNVHDADPEGGDCKQPGRYDGDRMARVLADVPALLAALDAVMALHHKSPIYDTWVEDCGHNFECDGVEGDDGYSYCPDSVSGYTCAECAELNKDNMDGELPDWPCPTVRAVSAALGGEE